MLRGKLSRTTNAIRVENRSSATWLEGSQAPRRASIGSSGPIARSSAAAQIAAQRVEVAVDPLERRFEAREGGVERRPLRQELGFDEGAEGGGIAVVGAPRALHLGEAARDPRALHLAVPRHERGACRGRGVAVRVGVRGHRRRQRDEPGEGHDLHESAIHVASILRAQA